MQENEIRALYRRTMDTLHCPPGLTVPRRRRRRPAAPILCAAGLVACGAVAASGITMRDLGEVENNADSAFAAHIELPLTAPDTLPAAIREAATQMQPWPSPAVDEGMQVLEFSQFQLTPDVGLEHGEDYLPGEALLPMDSWEEAGAALGWNLAMPAAAEEMNEVTDTLTNSDFDVRYKALIRVAGDTTTDTIEWVSAETRWSSPQGRLSLNVYALVGEGEAGTLDTIFRFWMGDTTWQPEDYTMANGTTVTIAVPNDGYNPNGLWAYFVEDGKLYLIAWNYTPDDDTARELADLKNVLDSFS